MKIKQTMRKMMLGGLLLIPVVSTIIPNNYASAACGGVPTAIINCTQSGTGGEKDAGLWGLLLIVINILTAGVGVVALAGLVYGSIMYTSAGGNPEQVKKARTIFTNIVIGIIAYAAMWALLNFIIPGGVL